MLIDVLLLSTTNKFWSPLTSESNLRLYGQGLVRLPDYLLPITTSWYQAQHRLSEEQVVDLGQLADLDFEEKELPVVFFLLVMGYLPRTLPVTVNFFKLLDLADFLGWSETKLSIYGHLLTCGQTDCTTLYSYLAADLLPTNYNQPSQEVRNLLIRAILSLNYTTQTIKSILTKIPLPQVIVGASLDWLTLLTALRDPVVEDVNVVDLEWLLGPVEVYTLLNGTTKCPDDQGLITLPSAQLPVTRLVRSGLPFGLSSILVDSGSPSNLLLYDQPDTEVYPQGPCLGQLIIDYLDNKLKMAGYNRLLSLLEALVIYTTTLARDQLVTVDQLQQVKTLRNQIRAVVSLSLSQLQKSLTH